MFAVLVEGRCPDQLDLPAGEWLLQYVGRVDRSFGSAGTDYCMDLVDEDDRLTCRGFDLLNHRLQPILELSAKLGPGDHCGNVEGDYFLSLQGVGHIIRGDQLRQPFDDCGLSHPWLPY